MTAPGINRGVARASRSITRASGTDVTSIATASSQPFSASKLSVI
jgi:hypothetical protein